MTLDFAALGQQLSKLGLFVRGSRPAEDAKLNRALDALREHADDFGWLAARAARAAGDKHVPFRAAQPLERLDCRHPLPTRPASYTVIGTDGSHIEPDQHGAALCYVLNVGWALVHYGPDPFARLGSQPYLGYTDEDLYLMVGGRQVAVEGNLLAIKRHIAEASRLADLAVESPKGAPVVGMQDGSLLLSASGRGEETYVWRSLLDEFLGALERLRQVRVPAAAYVSHSRAMEVANLLRLAICPHSEGECPRCLNAGLPPCAELARLPDRAIFEGLPLRPGERSAVFRSSWATSLDHYDGHRIHFFYAHTGAEVVRVEIPEWVAIDRAAVDLVQAVLCDQCSRGQGYPRVLIEAHEKAVITAVDRRAFVDLLDRALIASGASRRPSEKLQSKRLRTL